MYTEIPDVRDTSAQMLDEENAYGGARVKKGKKTSDDLRMRDHVARGQEGDDCFAEVAAQVRVRFSVLLLPSPVALLIPVLLSSVSIPIGLSL